MASISSRDLLDLAKKWGYVEVPTGNNGHVAVNVPNHPGVKIEFRAPGRPAKSWSPDPVVKKLADRLGVTRAVFLSGPARPMRAEWRESALWLEEARPKVEVKTQVATTTTESVGSMKPILRRYLSHEAFRSNGAIVLRAAYELSTTVGGFTMDMLYNRVLGRLAPESPTPTRHQVGQALHNLRRQFPAIDAIIETPGIGSGHRLPDGKIKVGEYRWVGPTWQTHELPAWPKDGVTWRTGSTGPRPRKPKKQPPETPKVEPTPTPEPTPVVIDLPEALVCYGRTFDGTYMLRRRRGGVVTTVSVRPVGLRGGAFTKPEAFIDIGRGYFVDAEGLCYKSIPIDKA